MNKFIRKKCYFLYLFLLVISLIGCSEIRLHEPMPIEEKKEIPQPLIHLDPLNNPTVDDPSKTVDYYENLKTEKNAASRESSSLPTPIPASVGLPKPVPNAVAVPSPKIEITTHYQARLDPGWEANGLKYLSIDGLQYSHREVLAYLKNSDNSSPFSLYDGGILLINLEKSFSLELAFYPPMEPGHEEFNEFHLNIFDKNGKKVHEEFVNKRMQVYTIEK